MGTHIKDIVDQFLKKKEIQSDYYTRLEEIIGNVLDRQTKKHLYLKEAGPGSLTFHSDSSNFTYYFNLKKDTLIKEIQKSFPQIKEIKIKVS